MAPGGVSLAPSASQDVRRDSLSLSNAPIWMGRWGSHKRPHIVPSLKGTTSRGAAPPFGTAAPNGYAAGLGVLEHHGLSMSQGNALAESLIQPTESDALADALTMSPLHTPGKPPAATVTTPALPPTAEAVPSPQEKVRSPALRFLIR